MAEESAFLLGNLAPSCQVLIILKRLFVEQVSPIVLPFITGLFLPVPVRNNERKGILHENV